MFLAIITFCCVKLNVAFADFEEPEANISTEPNKTDEFAKVEEDIEQIKKAYDKAFTKQGKLDIVNTELEKVNAELEAHSRIKRGQVMFGRHRDTVVFDKEKFAALNFKKTFLEKLQKGIGNKTWKPILKSLIKTSVVAAATVGTVIAFDKFFPAKNVFCPNMWECKERNGLFFSKSETEACQQYNYCGTIELAFTLPIISSLAICASRAVYLIWNLIF